MDDTNITLKRPSDDELSADSPVKRQRTAEPESRSPPSPSPVDTAPTVQYLEPRPAPKHYEAHERQPTANDLGREGLRRSICLALEHVGFDATHKDALESFTSAADTYISNFANSLRRYANAARRNDVVPEDFELVLEKFNIPVWTLLPHLENPIPKEKLEPTYYDPVVEDVSYLQKERPFLGEELSGQQEKDQRPWIPKHFPPFPSPFTYKYTPVEPKVDHSKEKAQAEADARKAEQALRRINRAARISQQKELKAVAERDMLSRQRHSMWEDVMNELLPESGSGPAGELPDIADHSTIVDFGAKYARHDVPKNNRRAQANQSGKNPFSLS